MSSKAKVTALNTLCGEIGALKRVCGTPARFSPVAGGPDFIALPNNAGMNFMAALSIFTGELRLEFTARMITSAVAGTRPSSLCWLLSSSAGVPSASLSLSAMNASVPETPSMAA